MADNLFQARHRHRRLVLLCLPHFSPLLLRVNEYRNMPVAFQWIDVALSREESDAQQTHRRSVLSNNTSAI